MPATENNIFSIAIGINLAEKIKIARIDAPFKTSIPENPKCYSLF